MFPSIYLRDIAKYKDLFANAFSNLHLIIFGINTLEYQDNVENVYNVLAIIDNNSSLIAKYKKNKLVPFGEFLPFENFFKKIGLKKITYGYKSFSKGKERNIINIKNNIFNIKLLPLICYEIIYSGKIFKNNRFDYIVNISEDGWFGKSIGPEQHFTQSIFRAIESGKYVLRSTNNGITAIINPLGEVEKQVKLNESGYIDFSKMRKVHPTLFSKYGNKIFGLIILLYIFLIFSFNRFKNE